jgi:hypothetical protein
MGNDRTMGRGDINVGLMGPKYNHWFFLVPENHNTKELMLRTLGYG